MQRTLLAAALVLAALVMPGTAGAAEDYTYASWGWSEPAGPHVDFQWGEAMPRTRLSSRWSVNDCGGDAPFLCVKSNGKLAGNAELATFPISSDEALAKQVESRSRRGALRWHARRYYRIFSEDRERGCPPAYEFRPLPIEDATVAGRNAVRYGFIVVDGDGRTVERNVSFATLTRADLVIVAAEGLTSKACVGGEGEIFRPAELRSFSAFLAQLAADGRLPR